MAARISQHGIEVLRSNTAPEARVTQVVIEVLRIPVPTARRSFPIIQTGRITTSGTGTRVFPVVIN